MPPRTGPRRKRRPRTGAPRHFTIIRDEANTLAIAHRVELDDGNLVLRDHNDAIIWIVARGEWCEIRPTSVAHIPFADEADEIDNMSREQATLTNENDPALGTSRTVEVDTSLRSAEGLAPVREDDRRFVPSSPEEAQRILMEIERRLKPDYQEPEAPDAPPQTPIRKD